MERDQDRFHLCLSLTLVPRLACLKIKTIKNIMTYQKYTIELYVQNWLRKISLCPRAEQTDKQHFQQFNWANQSSTVKSSFQNFVVDDNWHDQLAPVWLRNFITNFFYNITLKNPAEIYLFKVKIWSTRIMCEICSKLTIKTPERCQWRRSDVFIVNFEQISLILPAFP